MRVGLFTDSYPPFINGVSTSVETLKKSLEKEGHTVYVVTVGHDDKNYKYDEKNRILEIPGLPLGIYDYRVAAPYPVKVVNKIRSWHLDVIHSHTELSLGIFARLLAKQFGIPLVHTYHTMYKDYTYYVSRNHKYFDMGCKKGIEYLSKFYCDNTANAFIVPTIKTYKLFREEYHYDKDIYIVPTGIDASPFLEENIDKKKVEDLRKDLGYTKKDFVLVFVGRMAQEKNIEYLLRVMSKIKNNNIKLLLVGDGPDKEKYEKLKDDLELSKTVTFAGRVEWTKMPYYYHAANACITASTTETQGLTVIEGLASGLPAICIEDDAFRTMVIEGLTGRFFKDEDECVKVIESLTKDNIQVESMSKQAPFSAKKFSTEEFAKSVIEVYNAAIKNFNKNKKKDIPSIIIDLIKKKRGKKSGEDNNIK